MGTPSVGDEGYQDPGVPGAQGRVDDMVKALGVIRAGLTDDNHEEITSMLDAADEWVEKAADVAAEEK